MCVDTQSRSTYPLSLHIVDVQSQEVSSTSGEGQASTTESEQQTGKFSIVFDFGTKYIRSLDRDPRWRRVLNEQLILNQNRVNCIMFPSFVQSLWLSCQMVVSSQHLKFSNLDDNLLRVLWWEFV